jgi:serine O-acetyltransferase
MGLWALLAEDFRTHGCRPLEQGFWAIAVHRFGQWKAGLRPVALRLPFSVLFILLDRFVQWTCGISISPTLRLGRRVRIWHHSGIVLMAESIGDDVQIRHNTTLGVARTLQNDALPTIEDRVDIGVGSCVLGRVRVGHDSMIGANAVVVRDVPPHSVAAGVPARVIKRRVEDQARCHECQSCSRTTLT